MGDVVSLQSHVNERLAKALAMPLATEVRRMYLDLHEELELEVAVAWLHSAELSPAASEAGLELKADSIDIEPELPEFTARVRDIWEQTIISAPADFLHFAVEPNEDPISTLQIVIDLWLFSALEELVSKVASGTSDDDVSEMASGFIRDHACDVEALLAADLMNQVNTELALLGCGPKELLEGFLDEPLCPVVNRQRSAALAVVEHFESATQSTPQLNLVR